MSCKSHWNFCSTYSQDQNLRIRDTLSTCDKRGKWGETGHYVTSFMLFLDMTSIPPLTHTLFSPQPPPLTCITSSYKHSHVLWSKSKSNSWTEARGLKLRFLIASRLCSLESELGRTSSLPIVSGWNLATRLSINFFCALLQTAEFRAAKWRAGNSQEIKDPETFSFFVGGGGSSVPQW